MPKPLSKAYEPRKYEQNLYRLWERGKFFTPKLKKGKKPFTIIMPPPNANDPLHMGHALGDTLEDIMVRYHRMRGEPTLWAPGYDHAGIETQVVFERKLAKEGKSRFDFSRDTFYRMLWKYTAQHWGTMLTQMKALGLSCDWARTKFTLDSKVTYQVNLTFKKLYDEGLVYKGTKLVNWDPKQQTVLSDLEVDHEEREGTLYFLDYGSLQIATVRPETIFADVAVAVHPNDKRHKNLVGHSAHIPLVDRKIPIIADGLVVPDFGTGALKITPGHDFTDAEIGERHKLPIISVINLDGRILESNDVPQKYWGLKVGEARKAVVEDLKASGKLVKAIPYRHSIAIANRSKAIIEPLMSEQWFLKMKPLAAPAVKAVKSGEVTIVPKHSQKVYFHWMENIKDWPISRQIWWGIRMPIYYHKKTGKMAILPKTPKDASNWIQDPNTFDTWFSSGQWPYLMLSYPDAPDYKYFYPTSIMETGYDILFFWVARMIMFGLYRTGKIPFHTVYLHGLVRDEKGRKMSKSIGNVIDPLEVTHHYGADAVRWALVVATSAGKDVNVGVPKIVGARNFVNKIWNAARFTISNLEKSNPAPKKPLRLTVSDKRWLKELSVFEHKITKHLDNFRFGLAADELLNFFWHRFADRCIEEQKPRLYQAKTKGDKQAAQYVLATMLGTQLKLLHPYLPFVTEAIWQEWQGDAGHPLIIEQWPSVK